MGASACSKPFVVQELLISSSQLIIDRVNKYKAIEGEGEVDQEHNFGQVEHPVKMLPEHCQFKTLDNTGVDLKRGENGLYCSKKTFTYEVGSLGSGELVEVFSHEFEIVGAGNEAVTYLFDVNLGFDFATAA